MSDYRVVPHRGKFSLAYNDPVKGRVRVALGTDDKGLAEARAAEVWRRATNVAPSEKVSDIWKAYVADRRRDGKSIDPTGSTWKALAPSFGYKIGSAITVEDCREHYKKRKALGRTDSTIKTELDLLKAALKRHYGATAPRIWTPPASKPREHHLTKPEFARFLEAVEMPHLKLFCILAVTTGARMNALLDLRWSMVDLDRRVIDLNPPGKEKTSKGRAVVPINKRAYDALVEAKAKANTDYVIEYADRPIISVKKGLQAASRRSGIQCSAHVLRHTAGVWMAEADIPMQKISQYLGHTSTRVTETVYARYSPSFMKDAAEALDW